MPSTGIFISYRRDDTAGYAGRLYDRLAGRFGEDRVFMDIDRIAPGHEFATDIDEALADCRACVVLIGRQWFSIADSAGNRRLDDPTDFVRLEIATAIRRGVRVFPVLVDRASIPASNLLPDDIRPLAGRQAIELTSERWKYDTGRLLLALEKELEPAQGSPPPRQEGGTGEDRTHGRRKRRAALVIGVSLIAVVLVAAVLLATRSSDPTGGRDGEAGDGSGSPTPALQGSYRVSMELTDLDGELGEDNRLWDEPSPTVGVSGDGWASQTWVFAKDGHWNVEERPTIDGSISEDGSYIHRGSAGCSSESDGSSTVTRRFIPTTTIPDSPPADSFVGTLTIHWDCAATGPIDATFTIEGDRIS